MRIYFKNVLCKTTCFEANAIKRKKTFEANFKFGLLRNQLLRAYSLTLFWTGLHRFLEYTIHLAEPAWLRDSYFYWDEIQIREGNESGTPYTLECSKQEVEKDLLYSVLEEIINYFIVNTFYSRDFNFKGFLKCHIWNLHFSEPSIDIDILRRPCLFCFQTSFTIRLIFLSSMWHFCYHRGKTRNMNPGTEQDNWGEIWGRWRPI